MIVWTCSCKYSFVIGKKKVFGPIWEDGSASCARLMRRREWKDGYADCAYRMGKGGK